MKTAKSSISFALTCFLSAPALADEPEELVDLAESEYIAAEALSQPVIELLESGNTNEAITQAFADSPLANRIEPQLPALRGQLSAIIEAYGDIAQCTMYRRDHEGLYLVRLSYQCQHEKFVSDWQFVVLKTQSGWILSNMIFQDAG